MIKGSMMYDQHGRKRKVKKLYTSKKATPNFAKQEAKQFKKSELTIWDLKQEEIITWIDTMKLLRQFC